MTFMYDFTRKIWIYLVRMTSDVFAIFLIFKAQLERQSEQKSKSLRIDGGGEYTSTEWEDYSNIKGVDSRGGNTIHSTTQ